MDTTHSADELAVARYDLNARDATIAALEREIKVRDAAITNLRQEIESRDSTIRGLQHRIREIYDGRLWQLASTYWKLRRRMVRTIRGGRNGAARLDVPPTLSAARSPGETRPAPEQSATPISAGGPRPLQVSADLADELARIVAAFESRYGATPIVLDWTPDQILPGYLQPGAVFTPPTDDDSLPHLDATVDIVAVQADDLDRLAEARRVAERGILRIGDPQAASDYEDGTAAIPICQIEWLVPPSVPPLPSVTIVIPVFNKSALTDACLDALLPTLPADLLVSIVVVDDASSDETPALLRDWTTRDPRLRVVTHEENRGFIDACNRGAAEADGEIVVFLNNDTLPQPGWLEPLLRLFRDDPNVGAAGAKLLFGNLRLQEAGGVIFKSGDGWNFGRNDEEPDAPLYNFVRQVDFCSGAVLATRRALFEEIGGFDTRYRPAYYEDVDYAFAVRQHGHKMLYQPASVVVHLEGGTGGTDLATGPKHYQEVNRPKLVEKWQAALDAQPDPPAKPNRAGFQQVVAKPGTRRILIGAPLVPEYDREGGSRRLFHFIEYLLADGWSVTFLAPMGPKTNRYKRLLEQLGVAVYLNGDTPLVGDRYATEAERLIASGGFEVAILAFWNLAEQYLPVIRRLSPSTRIIVDSIDLHFVRQARGTFSQHTLGLERKTLDAFFADSMIRELNIYAQADLVLAVSQKEADTVCDLMGDPKKAMSVPLTDELEASPLSREKRQGMLFLGNFRHPPNVEALEILCREIVPRLDEKLLAEHPISVVGTGLDDRIRKIGLDHPHIRMIGWVPSTVPYLHHARISVVPLLHGAGMKSKMVQTLMAGTPSVTTSIGVEGMDLVDGEHALIADHPRPFADHVTRLLTDADLWEHVAERGRARVMAGFSRDVVRKHFLDVLATVTKGRSAPSVPLLVR
jgi:GT2 family glycosyltransferase/glycosyltransferase involved in cell wall biosynthesis